MEIAKVTSKGQITAPKSILERLELNPGSKIVFLEQAGGLIIINPDQLTAGAGSAPTNTRRGPMLRGAVRGVLREFAPAYDTCLNVPDSSLGESDKSGAVANFMKANEEIRDDFRDVTEDSNWRSEEDIIEYLVAEP